MLHVFMKSVGREFLFALTGPLKRISSPFKSSKISDRLAPRIDGKHIVKITEPKHRRKERHFSCTEKNSEGIYCNSSFLPSYFILHLGLPTLCHQCLLVLN